jgi:hypothetical protein
MTFTMAPIVAAICTLIVERKVQDEILALIDALGKVTGRVRRRPIFYRQLKAEAFAYAGAQELALKSIEEAASLGLIDVVWMDRCPLLESLRGTARFAELRAQIAGRAALVLEAFT